MISPPGLVDKNFVLRIFLSCVNDDIEHMATSTILVKTKYFCNTKVPKLGEIYVQQKFSTIIMVPHT